MAFHQYDTLYASLQQNLPQISPAPDAHLRYTMRVNYVVAQRRLQVVSAGLVIVNSVAAQSVPRKEGDVMTRYLVRESLALIASLFLFLTPVIGHAQTEQAAVAPPPVEQKLIREGTFALQLIPVFSLEATDDEAEAESRLADVGIMPNNGWVADYPVTPDIITELQKSVSDAADAGKLAMSREAALKKFEEAKKNMGLMIETYSDTAAVTCKPPKCENYPDPTIINNYYTEEGPPVVTYYAPPPEYYYLYDWVESPFWWYGFWFPGFFVLNDFHRPIVIRGRPYFVSNHFNDIRRHRVFRIDPRDRFRGRTFSGIGVTNPRGFLSTGVPGSSRVIFNNSHRQSPTFGRPAPPSTRGNRSFTAPERGGGFSGQPSRGGRDFSTPSRGGRSFSAPSLGGRSAGGGGGAIQRRGGR